LLKELCIFLLNFHILRTGAIFVLNLRALLLSSSFPAKKMTIVGVCMCDFVVSGM